MVVALLVADQVIRDAMSGKWTIVGVYDKIRVTGFPAMHPNLGVYFRLMDAEGNYEIRVDVVRFTNDGLETIAKVDGLNANVKTRMAPSDFGLNIQRVCFPDAGKYEVRLIANNELLGEWPMHVTLGVKDVKEGVRE
jgi:hypothetical protein